MRFRWSEASVDEEFIGNGTDKGRAFEAEVGTGGRIDAARVLAAYTKA